MLALPENVWLLPFAAALAAGALATFIVVRPWAEAFHRRVALALGLTALVELAFAGLLFLPSDAVAFRQAGLSFEFLRMAALFLAGAALIGGPSAVPDSGLRRRSRIAVFLGVAGAVGAQWGAFVGIDEMAEGAGLVRLGPNGRVLLVVILLGLVFALAQLEAVLRASRDPLRFRIKFVILGLCALAGFELYVTSQTLLLGAWRLHHAALSGLVTLVSVGMVAFGLGRMRLARTLGRVSVSSHALYGSLTLLGVGLYLLGVGLLGEALRLSGRTLSVGGAELGVFVVTTALVAAASSRAVRARFRDYVSRNLLRSRYDYRTKWLEATDAFRTADSVDGILDRLLDLLARTFGTGRLSVWMRYEADGLFHQVRSINIEPAPPPLRHDHPVVAALATSDAPVDLESLVPAGAPDTFLEMTRAVLGVPVRGAGELQAFLALGPAPTDPGYDTDDRDLLRAIAHHAGMLLAHAGLADERQAAAEIDALNRFAAFYLHDFKNLTARLSLVAQNAVQHGDDPEFRASALETVGRTAQQMNELLAGLAHRSPELGRVKVVDLYELVKSTLASLGRDFGAVLEATPEEMAPVLAAREQLQQVLLNLVLNARKALDSLGESDRRHEVRVVLSGDGNRVHLQVIDEGPGIAPESLRTLFRPFRSETSGGFGIGLYESKRIVESYGGRLRVVSSLGKGTRVTVELPTVAPAAGVVQTAAAVKEKER